MREAKNTTKLSELFEELNARVNFLPLESIDETIVQTPDKNSWYIIDFWPYWLHDFCFTDSQENELSSTLISNWFSSKYIQTHSWNASYYRCRSKSQIHHEIGLPFLKEYFRDLFKVDLKQDLETFIAVSARISRYKSYTVNPYFRSSWNIHIESMNTRYSPKTFDSFYFNKFVLKNFIVIDLDRF